MYVIWRPQLPLHIDARFLSYICVCVYTSPGHVGGHLVLHVTYINVYNIYVYNVSHDFVLLLLFL